jgi:outer membrane protein assembly factor BamD
MFNQSFGSRNVMARIFAVCAALVLTIGLSACASSEKSAADRELATTAEKLYREAKNDMASGNWADAISGLEKIEARFPFGLLAQQAQIDLAYAHYRGGDRAQATSAVERFIKLHPNHPVLDYALYLRGVILFNDNLGFLSGFTRQDPSERDQQSMRDSFEAFKELVQRFPDSLYTADARQRLQFIRNALAQYDVHVARYYLRRGAFLAAANRAQKALVEYEGTPAQEEALVVLVQSYSRLGLEDLRKDAERVYTKSFPQSTMLAKGLPERQRPWWQLW